MPSRNPIATPAGSSPFSFPQGAIDNRYNELQKTNRLKIPAVFCTVVLNLEAPLPAGSKLEIYYIGPLKPWLSVDLKQVPNNPNAGYATLTHSHIINPPFWEVTYKLIARAGDGSEKYQTNITMWKTLPEKCWDGTYPNPVNMWCPVDDG